MSGNINTENNFTLSTISSVESPKYDFTHNIKNKSSFYESNKVYVWIGITILVVIVFYRWFNSNYTCAPNDKQPIKDSLSRDISSRLYNLSRDHLSSITDPSYMDKQRAKSNTNSDSSKNVANSVVANSVVANSVVANTIAIDTKKIEKFINKLYRSEHFNKEHISDNDVNRLVNIIDNQLANNFVYESIFDELQKLVNLIGPAKLKNHTNLLKKLSDRSEMIKKIDKLNEDFVKLKKSNKSFNNLYELLKKPLNGSKIELNFLKSSLHIMVFHIRNMKDNLVMSTFNNNKTDILALINNKISLLK